MRTLRRATAQDVPDLIALDTVVAAEGGRAAEIPGWVAAGDCRILCEENRPVAYAVLTHGFFHQPFLEMLMVAAPARRSGAGRALVMHCIGLVPFGEKLWTSTNESNLPMQALLTGLGFVRSGIVENLDPGDPELIFVRLPPNGPVATSRG